MRKMMPPRRNPLLSFAQTHQTGVYGPRRKGVEELPHHAVVVHLAIPFTQKGEHRSGKHQELQRVALQKAMFSSPFAALDSTRRRIALLQAKP